MNKDWEKLWKEDLRRRDAEAQALSERYKAKLDVYAAKLDVYVAQAGLYRACAQATGITADHPLARASVQGAPKLEIPVVPFIEIPRLSDLPKV